MVELGHEMRQSRLGAGVDDLAYAADLINHVARRANGGGSVTSDYLSDAELGNTARGESIHWEDQTDTRNTSGHVYFTRIPRWLAEAYDTAFGADGHLVDLHAWAQVRDRQHRSIPPTAGPPIPLGMSPEQVHDALWEVIPKSADIARALLTEQDALLREALRAGSPLPVVRSGSPTPAFVTVRRSSTI